MKTYRLLVVLLSLFALLGLTGCAQQEKKAPANEIIVAAASDLTPAFEELGRIFEQEAGTKVIFSFGSTGQLTRQIEQGAPVDLFAAANIGYIDQLERGGLILPDTKALYARGRITLWTRAESPVSIEKIEDLAREDVRQVAIANPEHAPYGIAAREALERAGIWEAVAKKIVQGENVRQALQYAETGNADVAIVALSLSIQSRGRWVLVPNEMHSPLDQALAVIKARAREQQARRFAAFVNGERGRAVMRKYGFILPGEEPAR
jgi:molybdate transport system substrate-binding protein